MTFRLHDGTTLSISWEGPDTQKVKTWWVLDDVNGNPRPVDTAVQTFDPNPESTSP